LGQNNYPGVPSKLERTSRALEILTVLLVVLVSPLSFVISLPFGITPQTWLSLWVKYVFIFVVLAICIALTGFGAAASYRVKAEATRRTLQKG
jgi:hypothetical protein